MTTRIFTSPEAFRRALDDRLRKEVPGAALNQRRQLVVFDRFLARVSKTLGDAVTLKGGLVLELRLERARTTKDVDLRVTGAPHRLLGRLQEAGRLDLGDFMTFEIVPDREHPQIVNDGMKYEGQRFRAECFVGGKLYGQRFGVDVAFGDPMHGKPDVVSADDTLAFIGVAPPRLRLYPVETHIAEKLHAYTQPRARPNTRVKDLPDLALLATVKSLEARSLRAAINATWGFRETHPVPEQLPSPPEAWKTPYETMAAANDLPWKSIIDLTVALTAFLDPILGKSVASTWSPRAWRWT